MCIFRFYFIEFCHHLNLCSYLIYQSRVLLVLGFSRHWGTSLSYLRGLIFKIQSHVVLTTILELFLLYSICSCMLGFHFNSGLEFLKKNFLLDFFSEFFSFCVLFNIHEFVCFLYLLLLFFLALSHYDQMEYTKLFQFPIFVETCLVS